MDEITRNADGFAVIYLANMRGEVLVDDEDWPNMMQFSWYIKPSNKTSYAQRTVARKSIIHDASTTHWEEQHGSHQPQRP